MGKEKAWQLNLFVYADVYIQALTDALIEVAQDPALWEPGPGDFEAAHDWVDALTKVQAERERRLRDRPRWLAESQAIEQAHRGIDWSWGRIRDFVWSRDSGICQVCGRTIEWEEYDCGHIIDRCAGGSDRPSNLMVMCETCNQAKPVHHTFGEFLEWVESGQWRLSVLSYILQDAELARHRTNVL